MKTFGLALLATGVVLLLLFALRPFLAGLVTMPVIVQISLGLIALGVAVILIVVLVEKARSGGE